MHTLREGVPCPIYSATPPRWPFLTREPKLEDGVGMLPCGGGAGCGGGCGVGGSQLPAAASLTLLPQDEDRHAGADEDEGGPSVHYGPPETSRTHNPLRNPPPNPVQDQGRDPVPDPVCHPDLIQNKSPASGSGSNPVPDAVPNPIRYHHAVCPLLYHHHPVPNPVPDAISNPIRYHHAISPILYHHHPIPNPVPNPDPVADGDRDPSQYPVRHNDPNTDPNTVPDAVTNPVRYHHTVCPILYNHHPVPDPGRNSDSVSDPVPDPSGNPVPDSHPHPAELQDRLPQACLWLTDDPANTEMSSFA